MNDTSKLVIAQEYVSLGFKVFPVHAVENDGRCTCENTTCTNIAKHPVTTNGVHGATDDDDTLIEYFTGGYAKANIGIATGEASNVIVLDVDDIGSLQQLENDHGKLPPTWTAQTPKGGEHRYFRFDDRHQRVKNSVKFAGALDVRTTGGYVIAPPSIGANGNEYRWLISPTDCELANVPDWLLSLMPKRDDDERKSDNVDAQGDLNPASLKSITVHAETSTLERAKRYLDATPPAISGERGHDHTFGVVCHVCEHFSTLDDDEILDALQTWNESCSPPWTDKELRHKIKQARKRLASTSTGVTQVDDSDDWPTLHADALYGVIGDVIRIVEPHTEADTSAIVVTFFTTLGHHVGRKPHFVVSGTTHHANLFSVIVGDSSRARKGTSSDVVRKLFAHVPDETKPLYGLSSGEGLVWSVRDGEIVTRDDGTFAVEGGVDDKRRFVIASELGQTLRVLKRDGNTLSPIVRTAWDSGEMCILTKGKELRATNAHVSILAHITQPELAMALEKSDDLTNGFANRFLWALVKRSKYLPNAPAIETVDGFDALRCRVAAAVAKASTIDVMRRSDACNELWCSVYRVLTSEKPGTWDVVTCRAEAQVLRLSMLYALCDGSPTIEVAHLKAALALWSYCDDSARLIFGDDDDGWLERKIIRVVNEHPQGVLRHHLCNAVCKKTLKAEFDSVFAKLQSSGKIVIVTVHESKRPAEKFFPGSYKSGELIGNDVAPGITPPNNNSPDDVDGSGDDGGDDYVDDETIALADTEFYDELTGNVTPATLTELLDWRNANGVRFRRMADGSTWVTPAYETLLTPTLSAAIHAKQETLSLFVSDNDNGELSADEFETFWANRPDVTPPNVENVTMAR
jgi:hypothetical protein